MKKTSAPSKASRSKSAKSAGHDTLPTKAVLDELKFLRASLREWVKRCAGHLEAEITSLLDLVSAEAEAGKPPKGRAHDLRDMLMHLHALDIHPAKGRRRDLKKIVNTIEELRQITERW